MAVALTMEMLVEVSTVFKSQPSIFSEGVATILVVWWTICVRMMLLRDGERLRDGSTYWL